MKNKYFRALFYFVAALTVSCIVNSCKKDEPDTETTSVTDNSLCEGEFSRFMPAVNHIAVGDSGVQKGGYFFPIPSPSSACPDYYIDSMDVADGFPVTMWLYYGLDADGDSIFEQACTGNDGKVRAGIIQAVFHSPWGQVGSQVDMILKNYYVNNINYIGTVSVTQTGAGTFSQVVQGGKCTAYGWNVLWNCNRSITNMMGDTANPYDDVSLVSGTAGGTDRNGKVFSVVINSPLKRAMGCPWIEAGNMTLKLEGKKDRTIDFGDGNCDNKAIMTIDGNDFEFDLQ